jgi:hypothetical protein
MKLVPSVVRVRHQGRGVLGGSDRQTAAPRYGRR